MRPLRYSIHITLDGCCDHRAGVADEDTHRHATENLARADALIFGRVTYGLMEFWRPIAGGEERPAWLEPWMEEFARTIDVAKKYVVSSTREQVGWNTEVISGDVGEAVRRLKQEPGRRPLRAAPRLPGPYSPCPSE